MQTQFKLIIGCDLAAFDFKTKAVEALKARGYSVTDIGCWSSLVGDYPAIAEEVATRVVSGEFDKGLVICGTGQGVAMAANKVKGTRAALCYDVFPAIMSREHNNSNVLASGCWLVSLDKYLDIVEAWLFGKYNPGRHDVRINYMLEMENKR